MLMISYSAVLQKNDGEGMKRFIPSPLLAGIPKCYLSIIPWNRGAGRRG
jgi:hypothetical protein